MNPSAVTVTFEVERISCHSGQAVLASTLRRRAGVGRITANWATESVSVSFDPGVTDAQDLARWIDDADCQCTGEATEAHTGHGGMDMSGHVRAMPNYLSLQHCSLYPFSLFPNRSAGAGLVGCGTIWVI